MRPTTTHINQPHRAAHAITGECTLPPSAHDHPTNRSLPPQRASYHVACHTCTITVVDVGESRHVRVAAAEEESGMFVKDGGGVSVYGVHTSRSVVQGAHQ
jgi:hypothetical protein